MNKRTLIVGDLNYCHKSDINELNKYFHNADFTQIVTKATHIKGGILDQVQFRGKNEDSEPIVDVYPTYYTYDDHDIITVLFQE